MDVDSLPRFTVVKVPPVVESEVGKRSDYCKCGTGIAEDLTSDVLEQVRRRHVQSDVSSPRPERPESNVNQLFHPPQANNRGVRIPAELVFWNAGHSFCKNVDLSLGFPF